MYFGRGGQPPDWTGPTWPDLQFGHLWFIGHLLILNVCYALLRFVRVQWLRAPVLTERPVRAPPSDVAILVFALLLSVVSAVVRIWYPIDRWVGMLGFIQTAFADVPRDLSFFVLGVVAYRDHWFESFLARRGYRWLWMGLGLGAVLVVTYIVGVGLGPFWTLWESLFCCGMCCGLLTLFRERVNARYPWSQVLAGAAYGAYLFHVPIVVALQYAIRVRGAHPLLKFGLVSLVGVPLSFGVGALLKKLPLARRVL